MRAIKVQQNTPEWLRIRCGRVTASRMVDVMAKRKTGSGEMACRRDYRIELLCERLTGEAEDHYVSPYMDRGTQQEPFARAAYEIATGALVDPVGFVLHSTFDWSGASPDSLVDSDGGLEIKCPKTANHLEWRMSGVVPSEHQDQMLWNMACCEREWWDFVSYDERLPMGLRIFVCRLYRDDKRIREMETEARAFNEEVERACEGLGYPGKTPQAPALRSDRMVRIGALDVPEDIASMVGGEIMP